VRLFAREDDHGWAQRHLSHYVDGDLRRRARRRIERHAADCPDCSRGIRAMKALLRVITRIDARDEIRAPDGIFDRVRADAITRSDKPEPGTEE
jgi:anti-sigma factor RsiW